MQLDQKPIEKQQFQFPKKQQDGIIIQRSETQKPSGKETKNQSTTTLVKGGYYTMPIDHREKRMQASSPNSKSKEDGNTAQIDTIGLNVINNKPQLQYVEGPKTLTPSLLDLNENQKTENDYDVIT